MTMPIILPPFQHGLFERIIIMYSTMISDKALALRIAASTALDSVTSRSRHATSMWPTPPAKIAPEAISEEIKENSSETQATPCANADQRDASRLEQITRRQICSDSTRLENPAATIESPELRP
jgi:hypothetical protein